MSKWNEFFNEKIKLIFESKKDIVDIGGGLRVLEGKGNRYEPKRAWIKKYLDKVNYKILDPVPDYNPDLVGDIHNLPLEDNSIDAILCLAVLEHIENPFKAFAEMHRVLKPGGYCLIYVPFLYYYHAEQGYYGDFWRYTPDSLKHLSKDFSSVEMVNVRGAFETWIYLSPFGRFKIFNRLAQLVDRVFKKQNSKQTSGFNVFLTK